MEEEDKLKDGETTQEMGEGAGAAPGGGETVAAMPSKRDAFVAMLREYDPEIGESDPEDDYLFDYAQRGLMEHREMKGKYDAVNQANEKFAQVISGDPKVAQFIALIANGENPWYALGKTFGNMVDQLDEESLDKLKQGQAEYTSGIESMRKNFAEYEKTLQAFVEEKELTEEDASNINNCILDIADALNSGDISREVIENVWNGMDKEAASAAEIEAAKLAAKNEAIEDIKNRRSKTSTLPDMGGSSTKSTAARKPMPPITQSGGINYKDPFGDVEKIK
jgi:hypothetical protein